jgi:hypothetical protein
MGQDGGRRRVSRRIVAQIIGCIAIAATVVTLAYFAFGGGGGSGGGGSKAKDWGDSPHLIPGPASGGGISGPREVLAANAVAGDNGASLSQQYADAKRSGDARFGAKVTTDAYQTGYTEESKVDCGDCKWVLRDLDQCCEKDCNADPTTSSPYYCSGSDVAGDKMYDCHAGMCKENTMGKQCNAAALKTLRQGNNTTGDARCKTYVKKVLRGAAAQTCLATNDKGKCTQWSK